MTLSQINVFPIKSCAGISPDRWSLEHKGLRLDRRWMLVDERNVAITQRDFPRMTKVAVQPHDDHLLVEAPGMDALRIAFDSVASNPEAVVVWDDTVDAFPAGNEATEWFCNFLGARCKLVAMTEASVRRVDPQYSPDEHHVSFADGFPLLLISEASLADVNSRLEKPVPMLRFRPNLVVDGCEPFAEDTWSEIEIGGIRLHVVKPCGRCVVTTIDTETAVPGTEPLRTLSTYRTVGNNVMFGQNVIPAGVGELSVGSAVHIIHSRTN